MIFRKKSSEPRTFETKSGSKTSGFQSISSIFKGHADDSSTESVPERIVDQEFLPEVEIPKSSNKSVQLIQEVQKLKDRTIIPFIDYNEGQLLYPILSKIGEQQENLSYLDGLVSDGILEKEIYEKLIVCPIHSDTFSSSVRLYCPKCYSMDVEKLNLFEHKKCGYITESSNFDFTDNENSQCPSCKKPITNFEKEIRVPAMWYQCNDCSEKFDDAVVKLHCRKYEHDFDTNSGQFVSTFRYKLKNSELSVNSDTSEVKDEIQKLLIGYNFDSHINYSIQGKSNNTHEIPIYGKSKTFDESILIFIKNQPQGIDQTDMNSILVPKLDIEPAHTLLITSSAITDGVEQLAKHYGIHIICEPDLSQIISRVEEFVSEWYSKSGGKK